LCYLVNEDYRLVSKRVWEILYEYGKQKGVGGIILNGWMDGTFRQGIVG